MNIFHLSLGNILVKNLIIELFWVAIN